jgi:hemerythrin
MAGLTKQHFKEIAKIINNRLVYDEQGQKAYNHKQIESLLNDLNNYFKTQNPLFNENRFKKACLK